MLIEYYNYEVYNEKFMNIIVWIKFTNLFNFSSGVINFVIVYIDV